MTERRAFLGNEQKNLAQILRLGVALALTVATVASAQSYRVLKNFTGGSDGAYPNGGLVLAGNTLYVTTSEGGSLRDGVVSKMNPDGTAYAVLKTFTGSDGKKPTGSLVLSGSTLYGTTAYGGMPDDGVVFKMNTDGSGYAVLKSFTGSDGAHPYYAGMVLSGYTLYGTTGAGGISNNGAVFKINTDGSGYAALKTFSGNDGANPNADLVMADSTLYGTTYYGGSSGAGVVFKVNTDGAGYTVLKSFNGSDGANPQAGLALSGSTLYGTASWGGISNVGVVFKMNTDGSGYAVLKNFTGSDGKFPLAGSLILAGSTLYGTTSSGGIPGGGVVFKMNTDGTGYAVLKNFTGSDGSYAFGGMVLTGGTLYGTTIVGGGSGCGVVFSLALPPDITSPPLSQTAETGSAVTFQVTAGGAQPIYQWFFNGTNRENCTNCVLQLAGVQPSQAGAYTVVVTNCAGTVTSAPALLSVIVPVARRTVPALTLTGQTESLLNLDSRTTLDSSANWATLDTVLLTNASQKYFDLTAPLAAQRFYRAWQTNVLSPPSVRDVHLVQAITLTGAIGSSVRVDYINQFGPIDAWVTLDTVTLTNTTQLYFDISGIGQPARLYRIVP